MGRFTPHDGDQRFIGRAFQRLFPGSGAEETVKGHVRVRVHIAPFPAETPALIRLDMGAVRGDQHPFFTNRPVHDLPVAAYPLPA